MTELSAGDTAWVMTSAAARENVECPETYPANGGVTKVGR